ncbi:8-amino-7-oxononanoate synthase [Phocaeicola coprophilus]|uniref:8-amino-7-oxononanoate synthase n=1 Tax=Phocaeicola coprophilus TaxID=387090 RepID=UPI004026B2AF
MKLSKTSSNTQQFYQEELKKLKEAGNLRTLPEVIHDGKWVLSGEQRMLNLSSNDYLGLATDTALRDEFLGSADNRDLLFSSSSSRLLTGNFHIYTQLERLLADLFGTESALTFGSGYHMNSGILPAITDSRTLILADKLVHASIIDGILLSSGYSIRYRHHDYRILETLIQEYHKNYSRIIIVTESVFSMDGDVTPLQTLVELKNKYPNVYLYVDEAHGIGVRGAHGLGVAEEQGCIKDIDFLCGTFGKALGSIGAYVVCRERIRNYLVNKVRPFIFTTALPPVNIAWTKFLLERLSQWDDRRQWLAEASSRLRTCIREMGCECTSESQIVPLTLGASEKAIEKAAEMQRKGFYVLPVRPPTVPEGTSRLRFSLTAAITPEEISRLIQILKETQNK